MKITAAGPQSAYSGLFAFDPIMDLAGTYETSGGHNPAIMHTHVDWMSNGQLLDFQSQNPILGYSMTDLARNLAQENTVLAISWDPLSIAFLDESSFTGGANPSVPMQDILDGTHDAYLRQVANQVKAMDTPILMSLFGEADSNGLFGYGARGNEYQGLVSDQTGQYGDPSALDGPERVRDVFRHVIDIFREEGVDNVTWFQYLASGGSGVPSLPPEQFYAGDDYIDWVGQSLYLQNTSEFTTKFEAGYNAWGAITNKPYFIPELGFTGTGGGGAEVAALLSSLQGYDRLTAYTWANYPGVEEWNVSPLGTKTGEWAAVQAAAGIAEMVQVSENGVTKDFSTWRTDRGDAARDNLFEGTAGSDVMIGSDSGGADQLVGLAGDDAYIVDNTGDSITEQAGGGTDTVVSLVSYTLPEEVEVLVLESSAAATLTGNAGNNSLIGNAGADTLIGMDGDDVLDGAGGPDRMEGGGGDDTYMVGTGDTVVEQAGQGTDVVFVSDNFVLSEHVETLMLQEGGAFSGTGNAQDNTLQGNSSANQLSGAGGNDSLFGAGGSDTLLGGADADILLGGDGADELDGGAGADVMDGGLGDDTIVISDGADYASGGGGADTFVYKSTGTLALVADFTAAEDILDLTAMGISSRAELNASTYDAGSGVLILMPDNAADQLYLAGLSYDAFETAQILL